MKSFLLSAVLPVVILITACTVNYKQNIRPDDLTGGRPDINFAYIYGTYSYADRSPVFSLNQPYLALDIVKKSSPDIEIYIALDDDQGYFFTKLDPGEYTLRSIVLNMQGQDFDSVNVGKDFKVDPGVILYFGNIRTEFLHIAQPYIWWGIKTTGDNYQNDLTALSKTYSGITPTDVINGYSAVVSVIQPFIKRDIFILSGTPKFQVFNNVH